MTINPSHGVWRRRAGTSHGALLAALEATCHDSRRCPAKTALNAVTLAFAQELAGSEIKVSVACPGHTATDLNGQSGPRTVDEAAQEPVRLALLGPDSPHWLVLER